MFDVEFYIVGYGDQPADLNSAKAKVHFVPNKGDLVKIDFPVMNNEVAIIEVTGPAVHSLKDGVHKVLISAKYLRPE